MANEKASKHASELSKLGASKGGKARAEALTADQRREQARKAATARWGTSGAIGPVQAEFGTPERPLRIGPIEIPCYVLADGRRVLAQRGLQTGVGLSRSGGKAGARRLSQFLASLETKNIDTKGLIARVNEPIRFIPPHGGNPADGYEATILPDLCAVVIEADQQGKLLKQQRHIAEQCRILLHGFAGVGIVALVDEATGFQDYRTKDALAEILEKFVAKELRPWLKTFPPEFYKAMYTLKGWHYADDSQARPGIVGHYTNDIIYERLAPGVLEELRKHIPRDSKGRLVHRLHQRLTEDIGHPKLRERLAAVTMLMKYSAGWDEFMYRLDVEFPRWGKTMALRFES